MGCDMHAFVERLDVESSIYYPIARLQVDRDYEFFGAVAGVREEVPALFEPRGIPADVSISTRLQYESESDAHTPSWLTADELRQVEQSREWNSNEHVFAVVRAMPDCRRDCINKCVIGNGANSH